MSHSKNGFPPLLTDRLSLRVPVPGDCGDFHKLLLLPEVTRFSDWPDAPTRAQVERSIKWMCHAYAKDKGCAWIIEDRVSSLLLGAIRFNRIDKRSKFAEIGYELHPSVWGTYRRKIPEFLKLQKSAIKIEQMSGVLRRSSFERVASACLL